MQLDKIKHLVSDDLLAIDELIGQNLLSEISLINQLGRHIIRSGGKRLRPLLVILSARAFGYEGQHHITLAAIVEFIHTATLLHDDVVDASDLRRGQETANAIWGNEASVLVGDYLFSRAFQMMVGVNSLRVMEILANASNTIAAGEVRQLLNCHDPETTESRYYEVIRDKTAKLFSAATELGALISQPSAEITEDLAQYGLHLGVAFQLIDDALDYTGNSEALGKNIGDDLAEGKPTLPLIYALAHAQNEQKILIQKAICDSSLDYLPQIQQAIASTGAIEYTYAAARQEAEKALGYLAKVPESDYRQALVSLAEFCLQRHF